MDNLKPALQGQYHAALDMLKSAIDACPESLWTSGTPPRDFWRLAYHALFFAHLYLQVADEDFVPWELHRNEVVGPQKQERLNATPYTRAELLSYWELVDAMVGPQIDKIDLTSTESGFAWYQIPKLDHVIMNMRHIQEHAGQLRDRLIEAGIDQHWYTRRLLS